MERTGGCLCGAIRYRATIDNPRFGACHCPMCRKWTGGPLLNVRASAITLDGTPAIYPSSDWAERGFCSTCGSCLFYRLRSSDGPLHITYGSLDDCEGLTFTHQVFIDQKPEGYRFENDTHVMTSDEVLAMFSGD
jgi:hypothetical protein